MNENLFVLHRKNAIAEKQIKIILWYVVECYLLTLKNNKRYSKTWVKKNTRLKFENYLRNRLVEDYLEANKYLLKQKTLTLNNIDFSYETEKEYIDTQDNKLKPDKIDIYINKLGLQNEWKKQDKNVYFAIECKRIEKLSDANDYISDIEKFSNRNYIKTRLPFEGQIAFIENQNITHIILREKVNEILQKRNSIITDSFLNPIGLNDKFNESYLSKHQRNTSRENFSIYHLFFNYSNIVIN
jgi:hypothetical protein